MPPPSNRSDERKPVSFSIKGMAERESKPPPPPPVRKEIVIRKRIKARPVMSEEHSKSDSVYYRRTGNESVVGSGTYGKVYKAVHVYTSSKVALKKIRMEGERDGVCFSTTFKSLTCTDECLVPSHSDP